MITRCFTTSRWLSIGLISSSIAFTGCGGGSGSTTLPTTSTSQGTPQIVPATVARKNVTALARPASVGTTYASTVLADGAQVSYQLADTSTTLVDSGPNNVAGSYGTGIVHGVGAITTGGTSAGGFAGATAYDATMFTTTPPSPSLMPATLTLEAWIKVGQRNTTGKPLPIVSYGRYANGSRYAMFITPQNAAMYQQINVGLKYIQLVSKSAMVAGNIYHLVGTSDGKTLSLYVNGKLETTAPYAGTPDYGGTGNQGLYIGGAYQSNLPSFNGTIAQVAVYGTPLTAAQILNHFVAGQLAPMITETPSTSDGFVNSIGVNTHFVNYNGVYGSSYTQLASMLTGLGVRHIRDGLTTNSAVISEYTQLGAAGVHGLFTTQLTNTQSAIQTFPSTIGKMFEAYEAPNEQDDVGNPNWLSTCASFQQSLYSWVKTNPATQNFPVVGPALVNSASYPLVGNISAYMDNANVHDYMFPYNPGTTGYGSNTAYGVYGSIPYSVNLVKVTSGNKPVFATETGFGTNLPLWGVVDNYTLLRYIPRLLFEQINNGIVRTYTYELVDEGGTGTQMYQTFGLLSSTLTPKPAYTALKGLIAQLSDPGASFTPTPLNYQLIGNTNQVAHTLMQKHNGSYVLAAWIETPSWDTSQSMLGDIIVPAQSVTLNTVGKFSSATISTLDESGNLTTAPLSWSGTGATFNLTDKVSIITLNP